MLISTYRKVINWLCTTEDNMRSLKKELEMLQKAVKNIKRPYTVQVQTNTDTEEYRDDSGEIHLLPTSRDITITIKIW